MFECHDFPIIGDGSHAKLWRQVLTGGGQGVVSGCRKWIRHTLKEEAARFIGDRGGFSVHQPGGISNDSAECGTDGLQSDADAEYRDFSGKMADH